MDAPYQAASDVHVLPTSLALPGVGTLIINAFVLMADEPVLIDTGITFDAPDFVEALSSILDPAKIKWVWLTHDDGDHIGAVPRVMELAPSARLVTHGFAALRMATWWQVPLDRVYAIRTGDELRVGDRTLLAVPPPTFDNPMSTGIIDTSTGAYFCVDSFGAILPEATQHVSEIPQDVLTAGMMGWAAFDSPWLHLVDKPRFAEVLERVRRLEPTAIYSSHLPAASGTSLGNFINLLQAVPDAEPFIAPDHEAFTHLAAALAAGAPPVS
jgi:flavorubredoxin